MNLKLLAALVIQISPAVLMAENLHEMDLEELMEIRVRVSSLFEERESDTPAVVSYIEREEWTRRGSKRGLRDLLDFLPGIATYSTWGGTGIAVRGFPTNTSTVRGKAYLLDGVPLNGLSFRTGLYGRSNLNLQIFDSMEMVRGPGSAIYGADAFVGVIALNTYDPGMDESEFYSSVSDGKLSEFTLRTSQPLGRDQRISANFSVSGQGNQHLSYQSYQNPGQTLERSETWQAGTGLLKWSVKSETASRYEVTFLSHQWETDESPGLLSVFGPFFGAAEDNAYADTRFNFLKASHHRELKQGRTLEISAYHWSSRFDFQFDSAPPDDRRISGRKDLRSGLQLRLKSPEKGRNSVRWVVGADLDRLRVKETYLGFLNSGASPDVFDGIKGTAKGVFYQGRIPLNDQMNLHYGARLDRYPGFGNQFTPRLGLVYHPNEETTWKALYGNAFRAPTAGEISGTGRVAGNPDIKPEEMDSMELVYMKHSGNSHFQLTYFENRWKDGIQQDPVAVAFANIEKNESNGVEMSYKRKFSREWESTLSASRIRSMNKDTGSSYEAFPRHILNLLTDYKPINSRWNAWFGIRYMGEWKDGTSATANPLSSYLRTDISLSYHIRETTSAYFWVRNLFDRNLRNPSLWDSEIGVPEAGRIVGIGLSYKF